MRSATCSSACPTSTRSTAGSGVGGAYSLSDITYTDAQIDAPSRLKLGWATGKPVGKSGSYKITSVETSREVLTYDRPGSSPQESFVIERREKGTYDRDLPEYGIVIWRVVGEVSRTTLTRFKLLGKEAWPMNKKLDRFPLEWTDGVASGVTVSVDPKRADEVRDRGHRPETKPPAVKKNPARNLP